MAQDYEAAAKARRNLLMGIEPPAVKDMKVPAFDSYDGFVGTYGTSDAAHERALADGFELRQYPDGGMLYYRTNPVMDRKVPVFDSEGEGVFLREVTVSLGSALRDYRPVTDDDGRIAYFIQLQQKPSRASRRVKNRRPFRFRR